MTYSRIISQNGRIVKPKTGNSNYEWVYLLFYTKSEIRAPLKPYLFTKLVIKKFRKQINVFPKFSFLE